jgi:2-dehydro-3-deoxygluconokinase
VGLYFLEEAKLPRGSRVIYDRRGSAMANMNHIDLPSSLFQPGAMRAFHTTGISLGLGTPCSETVMQAMRLAKQAGSLVSFDVNYRALLWDRETALELCETAMELADLIFLPIRDARLFYSPNNGSASPKELLKLLTQRFPDAVVVMTVGADGAWAATNELCIHQSAYQTDTVERLGGGDAFSAGFLSRFVPNPDRSQTVLRKCLQTGCAVAALKYTIPGDFPIVEKAEVERLISSEQSQSIHR